MQWDYLMNAYEGPRQVPGGSDARESRHFLFVREFASTVSLLQDKTMALIETSEDIARIVEELGTCDLTTEAFSTLLNRIQKTVSSWPDLFG